MDIKVFINFLEQNNISYKKVNECNFIVETLNGDYNCWPGINRRKLVGLNQPCFDDLEPWLSNLRPLPTESKNE